MDHRILSSHDIQSLIPHRHPYLMLDRARVDADGAVAEGIKNISLNEVAFCGHFPRHPILPGVLQVEAIDQLACVAIARTRPMAGIPYIHEMEKIKFRRPVTPGDQLRIDVTLVYEDNGRVRVSGTTSVDGKVTCEAQLLLGSLATETLAPTSLSVPLGAEAGEGAVDIEGIMDLIPHAYPYLLIDRVLQTQGNEDGSGGSFIAIKNVTANEPIFVGMDVAHPVMPTYLIPEIAAQSGCAYVLSRPQHKGKIAYFMSIDRTVARKPIIPGDQLRVESAIAIKRDRFGTGVFSVHVGTEQVAEGEIKFSIMPREQ